ncbi:MAG TPA: PAS domain-containing protein [Candidatus Angelobacter sp.]|nr:PAS domain-containing protein [Candidatus Angelobacter sp.]
MSGWAQIEKRGLETGGSPGKFWPKVVLRWVLAIGSVGAAVVLSMVLERHWRSMPTVSLFFCAIMVSAWLGGFGPGMLALTLSVLAFDYYFLAPTHGLAVPANEWPRLIIFAVTSLFVVLLAALQRSTTESLRRTSDDLAAKVQELEQTNAALHTEITERKRAESALRRSEAYLSEAQRLSHTGSFSWKVSTGEIFWTGETFRIFQYDPTTKPTLDLVLQRVHPEDRDLVQQTIEDAARDGEDLDFEHRLLMPDGSVKPLHVLAHAEKDQAGETEFIGAVMDVTLAKEVENKIRLIINTVPGLLWTARPDGWVDFLSQRWLDYTGMTLEQGLGWAWQPGYHPDDLGTVLSKWRAAVAEVKPLEVEARLRRFDGEYRWFLKRAFPLFDNAGRVLGWYGGNIDIHDLKQAEAKLKQSETYLAEAQRLAHTGSWAWNVARKKNIYWSDEHYRIFGLDPGKDDDTYEMAFQMIHPDDRPGFQQKLRSALLAKRDFEADYRIVLLNGTTKYIHSIGHPRLDAAGKVIELVGTVVDVTERRRAETALREAQANLARVTRITTMGELTASIAHEVNQPLTAVINNANACISLLPKNTANREEVRQALTEIIDDADRASTVITRIRQLASNAPAERSLLDLRDVITDVMVLARHESVTRGVSIRTELPEELPLVSADRVQLQQVLLNLVVNGMDAMNTIEESRRVLLIRVHHEAADSMPVALLSVQDVGAGFKPEQMDRLFEAFYTTKPQGMGMGLAISRSIIQSHGGRLWAEPNQGPGATFRFSLPVANQAAS